MRYILALLTVAFLTFGCKSNSMRSITGPTSGGMSLSSDKEVADPNKSHKGKDKDGDKDDDGDKDKDDDGDKHHDGDKDDDDDDDDGDGDNNPGSGAGSALLRSGAGFAVFAFRVFVHPVNPVRVSPLLQLSPFLLLPSL